MPGIAAEELDNSPALNEPQQFGKIGVAKA